ncbi:hypothetical protein [Nocardia brevicatena]|uniref:hypothetical protein n=1 Tax=Nocardia brevicatena TaxID=37327 RepID=UPI0002F7C618|nr:hypothetical protein [Nocardia brevicatena]
MQQFPPSTPAPARDPWAVALADASLLGIGYLMVGRRRVAFGSAPVTLVLITVLTCVVRSVWFEIVLAAWWAMVTVYGGVLGSRPPRSRLWRQRVIAFAATVPILVAFAVLRVDIEQIGTRSTCTLASEDWYSTMRCWTR